MSNLVYENYSIVVLFDSSGSMESMMRQNPTAISIINEFIDGQKNLEGDSNLSLYFFNDLLKEVFYKQPLKNVKHITENEYIPDGSTALLDAVGEIIKKFDHENKVFITIITDGLENSSNVFCSKDINLMIKTKKEHGWKFKFFGTNQDSWSSGQKIGLNDSDCYNYSNSSAGLQNAMRTASQGITRAVTSMDPEN
jgi:hypothetical protein